MHLKSKRLLQMEVYDVVRHSRMGVCKVNNGDTAKELFKPFSPSPKKKDIERDGVVQMIPNTTSQQQERVWLRSLQA